MLSRMIQSIVRKLGAYSTRKQGEEFVFACPKCHRSKLEVNPRRKLFHCFRCDYKGTLKQILADLNIEAFSAIPVNSVEKPVEIEAQEFKIPEFYSYRADGTQGMEAGLHHFLAARGIESSSDLLVQSKWGYSTNRKLYKRLIIPIIEDKKIVSYVARAYDEREPKEISGPNKSWFLYNLDEIKEGDDVFIVEGIFDAEALRRWGMKAVAILGSNVSDVQIGKLLAKRPKSITIIFDGDMAGKDATFKAAKKLTARPGPKIYCVHLPDDTDPDEMDETALKMLVKEAWGWIPKGTR